MELNLFVGYNDEMISNINHITLAVKDIERSFAFYSEVLGLTPLVKWDKGAYFLVGNFWFCLNVDENREETNCYTHYAFTVTENDFEAVSQKIINSGAKIFKDNSSSGSSLYFLDPDGHKLEIHVSNWHARVLAKKNDPGNWKNVKWFV